MRLLPKPKCKECRSELLLNADDPHSFKVLEYPIHAKFTCFKQRGGLLLPSTAVLNIMKAAEVIFKKGYSGKKVTLKKNIDLKIQYAVLKHHGHGMFN